VKNWFFKSGVKEDMDKKEWEKFLVRSNDFKKIFYVNKKTNIRFCFSFITTLTDESLLQNNILPYLLEQEFNALEDLKSILPAADVQLSGDASEIEQKIFNGYILLTIETEEKRFAFIAAQKEIVRSVTPPEVEFSVIGPKESFVESLGQNINLIRKRLPIKELIIEEITVGKLIIYKLSFSALKKLKWMLL
jgi:hypothetical protein